MSDPYFIRLTGSGITKGPLCEYSPDTNTKLLIKAYPDDKKIIVYDHDYDDGYTIPISDLETLGVDDYEPILRIVKKELNYKYIDEYLESVSVSTEKNSSTTEYYNSSELPSSAVITSDSTDASTCDITSDKTSCSSSSSSSSSGCECFKNKAQLTQLIQDTLIGPDSLAIIQRYVANIMPDLYPDYSVKLKERIDKIEAQSEKNAKLLARLAAALHVNTQ